MSETVKKHNKRKKKESPEEIKRPERSVQAKHIDYAKGLVVIHNIRKEINDRERKIQNAWDQKFYYLSGQYFRKVLEEESAKAEIPVDTFERKRKQNPTEKSLIPLKPSPMPVPETSSAMIGWRSSRREYDLEFSGPLYVSDKHTIEPPLLPGEFRVTKQHVIFLG